MDLILLQWIYKTFTCEKEIGCTWLGILKYALIITSRMKINCYILKQNRFLGCISTVSSMYNWLIVGNDPFYVCQVLLSVDRILSNKL